jgi:hypothetical protein
MNNNHHSVLKASVTLVRPPLKKALRLRRSLHRSASLRVTVDQLDDNSLSQMDESVFYSQLAALQLDQNVPLSVVKSK